MMALIQANVLMVGLKDKADILSELPIRLISKQYGLDAARSLKSEQVNSVISRWDLDDMDNGRFLKNLKAVKPNIPIIAIVRSGDWGQEIEARSLGVSAVLSDATGDDFFRDAAISILKLREVVKV